MQTFLITWLVSLNHATLLVFLQELSRRVFDMASSLMAFLLLFSLFSDSTMGSAPAPAVGHVVEETPGKVTVVDLKKELPNAKDFQFAVSTSDEVKKYFSVDPTKGQIMTLGPIDREALNFSASDAFEFQVACTTGDSGSTLKFKPVKIYVDDINDNSPSFPSVDSLNASIVEDSEVLKVISSPSAYDPDIGNNSVQTYSGKIVFGNEDGHFSLKTSKIGAHRLKMEFVLEKSLDRETQQYYQFNVTVTDSGNPPRSAWILFNLTVQDVNDNAPVFGQTQLIIDVFEDSPSDTVLVRVNATDIDENPLLRYSIRSVDPRRYNGSESLDMFSIDALTGEIKLLKPLDYEYSQHRVIKLEVGVSDGKFQESAVVKLYVRDSNDHSPKIVQEPGLQISVKESVDVGGKPMQILAEDSDSGVNGILGFNLTGGMGYFSLKISVVVNLYVAVVVVEQPLDRESIDKFDLTVTIFDGGVPQRKVTRSYTVTVTDVNDNSPEFVGGPYSKAVAEDIPVDSDVTYVSATDQDLNDNGKVQYVIPSDQPLSRWFAVDPSAGVVKTAQRLDRETAGIVYLTVTAVDKGKPPRSTNTTVTVTLIDVNDNSPVFSQQQYNIEVPENESPGAVVAIINATDPDEGLFGDVTYSFASGINGDAFNLDPQSGALILNGTLDRETTPTYPFIVDAQDGGGKKSSVQVVVTVTDINEYPPEFYPLHYDCVIYENMTVGFQCVIVMSTDKDENQTVTYKIVSGNDNGDFRLHHRTGQLVTEKALDYEQEQSYDLVISAMDSGGLVSSPHATVNISVANVLDKPPRFDKESYAFTVNETESPGVTVGRVHAVKQDVAKTGQLKYSIIGGDRQGKFDIDAILGRLSLKKKIDREEVPLYRLQVKAECCGESPLIVVAEVNITVTDANDNSPEFTMNGDLLTVQENKPKGSVVTSIHAADKDTGLNGDVYYLLTTNKDGLFVINKTTGVLSTTQPLDYETLNQTSVTVTAFDRGWPQQSSSLALVISVTDVNDHSPVFANASYLSSVLENVTLAHTILRVSSSDLDSDSNNKISYSLDGDDLPFEIIVTGDIYVARQLDAETRQTYDFHVSARDNGNPSLSSTVPIHISVLDVNDNSPVFNPNMTSTFYVSENVRLGHFIGQLSATDRDQGLNGKVTYSITPSTPFQVDLSNGSISTAASIDRESKGMYHVTVSASDQGTVRRTTTAVIRIIILDVNDNAPIFETVASNMNVSEIASVNNSFAIISAQDKDAGSNGEITYTIESGNEKGDLYIDPKVGSLVVAKSLDRETTSYYTLTIKASDGGNPAKSTVKQIRVTVEDVNDNAPVFVNSSGLTIRVHENMPENSRLAQFFATDRDSGQNGIVSYSIFHGNINSAFAMDSQSGILRNSISLDYESKRTYRLVIVAKDNAINNELESQISVVVALIDVNDNVPTFSPLKFGQAVFEDIPVFASVHSVAATDDDQGTNGDIRYSILKQSPSPANGQPMLFTVEPMSGIVRTLHPLTAVAPSYDLTIVAEDQALVPADRLSSTATLTVSIQPPHNCSTVSFLDSPPLIVDEDTSINNTLQVIAASGPPDCSADSSSIQFKYLLDLGNDGKTFKLDYVTGELKLAKTLDRETQDQYSLSIRAYGIGAPPPIGARLLVVSVSDVNDNAPIFDKPKYTVDVEEGLTVAVSVVQVHADDADSGRNGYVTYTISGGNQHGLFTVNSSTGLIQTATVLTLPQGQNSFILTVRAEDNGRSPQMATVEVVVSVHPPILPPVFPQTKYVFSIVENNPDNALVGVIHASDKTSRQLNYRIVSTNLSSLFVVDRGTGELRVTRGLDYETETEFSLTVQAFLVANSSLEGKVQVTIQVLDANDNIPKFQKSTYDGKVNETAPVEYVVLQVRADDADSGSFGTVIYSLEGADGMFEVNSSTGWISTASPLDREKASSYIFRVRASESTSQNPQSTFALVQVLILDVNDNAPVFTQSSYEVNISSVVIPDIEVIQMVAHDPDAGLNGQISYSVKTSQTDFVLDPNTGLITTPVTGLASGVLYQFTVTATDAGSPPLVSQQQVHVHSVDPSTQLPPRFMQSPIHRLLDENVGAGFAVATVKAVSERSNKITYSFSKGNGDGKFSIGSTGAVTLAKSLDVDAVDYYDLVVRADDGGSPSLHSDMHLYVNVTSAGGDIAELIRPRIGHIHENKPVNTLVLNVTACNPFAHCSPDTLRYYLAADGDSAAFVIDQKSGQLRTAVRIDAEQRLSYDVVVTAVDLSRSSQSGTATIQITVFDENDNEPHFLPLSNVSLPENTTVGSLVTTLRATDDDVNHQLRYSLAAGADNKFLVESSSGRVTVAFSLDYETTELYEVRVAVYDGKHTERSNFYVTVVDTNDNPPQFSLPSYLSKLRERSPPGTVVANVSASDRDSGLNGEVWFGLHDSSNSFQIDPLTGIVSCSKIVHYLYGSRNIYDLTVIAYDRGTPTLSSEATVSVSIIDLNDHSPQFLGLPFSWPVPENYPPGATIDTVTAEDKDEGSNGEVNYQVVKGNATQWFTVEVTTGAIVVVGQGFTLNDVYILDVKAFDLGEDPSRLETSTKVKLTIVAKQPVKFTQTDYFVTVPENITGGTSVVTVEASVSSEFSIPLEYTFGKGSSNNKFLINESTGEIFTIATLDYSVKSEYRLTVIATDTASTSSASATVWINVTDVNNNAPVFTARLYRGEVAENSNQLQDDPIVIVSATDSDSGSNSRLWFSLVSSVDTTNFRIDNTSGIITAVAPLDYEMQHQYTFVVKAEDMGSPPLSSTVPVEVNVKGINEFSPVFNRESYRFTLQTTAELGSSIGRVTAKDEDSGPDGQITYLFQDHDGASQRGVSMTPDTGEIFLNHSVGQERRESLEEGSPPADFKLIAVARDNGQPSRSASADVLFDFSNTEPPSRHTGGSSSQTTTIVAVVIGVMIVLLIVTILLFVLLWRRKKRTGSADIQARKPIKLYVATNPTAQSQERQQRKQELKPQQREVVPYNERPIDVVGATKEMMQSSNSSLTASGRVRSQEKLLSTSPQTSSSSSVRGSPGNLSPKEDRKMLVPSDVNGGRLLSKKAYSPSQSRTGSEMRTNSDEGSVRSGVGQRIDPKLMQNIWRELEIMGLNDGQESTCDFNIQGGGEADGGVDLSSLLNNRLAEADAEEYDAIIDGTRAFGYEGASDTVTVSAGGSATSTGYAEEEYTSNPYGQDYRRPWITDVSRNRSPKQPPPMPAPVRPGIALSQPGHSPQPHPRHPLGSHPGRRPGAPPIAARNRLGRGLKNSSLSPCISPGASMSISLATTPAATPSAGNLSPILSPTLSPSERTESRGSTPSMTPTQSSVSVSVSERDIGDR